nr:hypothetical protein 1 [Saccharospirillaceae bacterium]
MDIVRNLLVVITFSPMIVSAHSGGLDAEGGHRNRETGEYHCHRDQCRSEDEPDQQSETGYNREEWGVWIDEDEDCLDTRQEILLAEAGGTAELSEDGCRVVSGVWAGPYSGSFIFEPGAIDIDHIVPIKWAYDHGASAWPASKKVKFANDMRNLWPVDSSINRSKGSKGLDEWIPETMFYCRYAQEWFNIL